MNLKQELKDGIMYAYLKELEDIHLEDENLLTYRDGLRAGIKLAVAAIERTLNNDADR